MGVIVIYYFQVIWDEAIVRLYVGVRPDASLQKFGMICQFFWGIMSIELPEFRTLWSETHPALIIDARICLVTITAGADWRVCLEPLVVRHRRGRSSLRPPTLFGKIQFL
ncbi:uncharacterized protein BJX67DRAFT_343337 [Aspergillus lucknowensis]|uniref:Uncharacterized protein n=1 Tax=Aspergillus lucknowensis TaxID=176173 RepID=A0ABR4M346_9EURO